MNRFFDPELFLRTYRDPLAWLALAVDLLPIVAILLFGWRATPLVALYWLENLVIGGFTVLRMLGSVAGNIANLGICLFIVPFFCIHYGMFCFGHGIFLQAMSGSDTADPFGGGPLSLVHWAMGTAPHMIWFVTAIAAVNAVFYIADFIIRGDFRTASPMVEMFAPYGRIVTLHVAIILGAGLMLALGQPLLGVLILIALRVAFGVALNTMRQLKLEGALGKTLSAVAEAG
ncbi:MAG: DUF6498-containing protein [Hyphomonas sp.]|uniref:DUF6498-containing protein n=1 Tax=Hyphomonas sp. TaxID=87 RepID=UPI003526DC17